MTLATLGDLAAYGSADAVGLLTRYALEGWNWAWAIDELRGLHDPDLLTGLEFFVTRVEADASSLMDAGRWLRRAGRTPAQTRLSPPPGSTKSVDGAGGPPPWEDPDSTTEGLLAWVADDPGSWYRVERKLRTHTSASDRDLMVAAIRQGPEGPRAVSFRALGHQHEDRILDWVDEALVDSEPERVRNSARVGLVRLGTPASTLWARGRVARADALGNVAAEVLATSGRESDVPALLTSFERARSAGDNGLMCDIADGFARLADPRGVPLLEATYRDAVYSYLRNRCALALAVTSADFPEGLAVESLWDCESVARGVGAEHASAKVEGVAGRLRELARDRAEDESVRAAALERS